MVKASAFQPKMTSTKGEKTATGTPKGSSGRCSKTVTPVGVDLPSCGGCGQTVSDEVRALQCDCCQSSEAWKCAECLNLSAELYDMLGTKGGSVLKWLCDKCHMSMVMFAGMKEQQQQMEERMNELTSGLDKRIDDMARAMNNGAGINDSQHLEEKLNDLSNKMDQKMEDFTKTLNKMIEELIMKGVGKGKRADEVGVEVTQKRVEEKVDKLVESMKKQRKVDSHLVHDCVEGVVRLKLKEDRQEAEEVNKRRCNVIIHGMRESMEADVEDRIKCEEDEIINLLHEIKCDNISVQKTTRLGRRDEAAGAKPRPVILTLASESQKDKLLSQAKNLRLLKHKDLDKVYINQDQTPKQRHQRTLLVQEIQQRQTNGEQNLIIVNGKIVIRRVRTGPTTSD